MDWKSTLQDTFSDCWTRRKLLGLLSFWLTGVLLVGFYAVLSGRLAGETGLATEDLPVFERNETGALTAWRKSRSPGTAPACKVVFDNLQAENGNLGVFKTASLKVVYVDRLRATFFADPLAVGTTTELSDFHSLFAPRRNAAPGANPLGLFDELDGLNADWSVPVDMANTTEVRIRQLDWQVRRGDRTIFHVRCRHATLRNDTPTMVLRGHVIVATPKAVLESNCVELNARDESIVVPGRYSLRCDGTVQTGSGDRFSKSLKPSGKDPSDTEGEHGWAKGFQLGSF